MFLPEHMAQGHTRKPTEKKPHALRTIGEVAEHLQVEQHVLRFWETKFTQVKPMKRAGSRRYYRPEDVAVLEQIYKLLYQDGYTIKGAQNVLKGKGKHKIAAQSPANNDNDHGAVGHNDDIVLGFSQKQLSLLKATLGSLKDMRKALDKIPSE